MGFNLTFKGLRKSLAVPSSLSMWLHGVHWDNFAFTMTCVLCINQPKSLVAINCYNY